ncbi:DNA alkylation repair protein [Bradyrhizobium sp.]|uniref:DNA alkylation repair protein n=1 Tax=Bradyrhizobium sp. TaxID=376 RepID=UPI00273679B8|nr:DNA alkylation repair protein [Bradyrhizobium sp.]MDP3690592.1 DNA alkylation repair protein [Bradyrhizobium sp.]
MKKPAGAALAPADYVTRVQAALTPLADAGRAQQMRAYLREQFPFLGLQSPVRRAAVAGLGAVHFDAAGALQAASLLWQLPEREYRYTAVDLLARHARGLTLQHIPELLSLAQCEPWWETVDGLAGVVGEVLLAGRKTKPDAQALMDEALQHASLWVRRIAMIHQLGWRLQTDTTRLYGYALALGQEEDFFIRKAIGWALRDYARWDPKGVTQFVARHGAALSALTVREATRRLNAL